jgi:hypothetical protein
VLKFGTEPYLECSSKGDRRFSAFNAVIVPDENTSILYFDWSIEGIYQSSKVFEDGSTGLSWREAKGKKPINAEECRRIYSKLWDLYFKQNPELLEVIKQYNGFSDIFGQEGHACQAEEIYRIRNKL